MSKSPSKRREERRFTRRMLLIQVFLLTLLVLSFLVGEAPDNTEARHAGPRATADDSGVQQTTAAPPPRREPVPSQAPKTRFATAWPEARPRPRRRSASAFEPLIEASARRHRLDPRLVTAVAAAESAFDPQALSPKGARGLMQVMPATARRFGVDPADLFQPLPNLEAGSRYLRWLSERYPGQLPLVLAAYNAGEQAVDRYGGVPPYPETRAYLRRIYRHLGRPATEISRYENLARANRNPNTSSGRSRP